VAGRRAHGPVLVTGRRPAGAAGSSPPIAHSAAHGQNGADAALNPNFMRTIDYWVGVPLTFLLTLAWRLQRLLGLAASPAGAPRRILFIQLAEMGTMVVLYPALRKARELFPEATLHVLCFAEIRASVEMLGVIPPERILTIDARSPVSLVRDTLAFPWRARRSRLDTVINTEAFVRYSSVLSYLSGAARRVGFHRFNQEGLYTGDLLTHPVLYNPHVHAAHTFLDLVHALDAPPDQVPRVKRPKASDRLDVPRIAPDEAAAVGVWQKLRALAPEIGPDRKLVVLNPNASARFPMRRMPLESFAAIAGRLLEDPDVFILITGVASERADAQFISTALTSPRVLDLTGRTTLTELLRLFDLAHVMVTNDSGPAHFAALTGIHVIVCFGPEIPDRYRPLAARLDVVHTGFSCSPCIGPHNQRLSPCNDNLCLRSIRVEDVVALVQSRLAATRTTMTPLPR
jgi:ADP-heptose:LPS heptosyltransferase